VLEDGVDGLFCASMRVAAALAAQDRVLPNRALSPGSETAHAAAEVQGPRLVH